MTRNPPPNGVATGDLLSGALRRIRISGSMQYCFMPSGNWTTDATPAPYKPRDAMGFHIVAAGTCWVNLDGEQTDLGKGDIAAFPFGSPHMIGAGTGGRLIDPGNDLPPAPWREIPILRYGDEPEQTRILCGYVQCEAMNFRPFKSLLPRFIHVRTAGADRADWLAATIAQIIEEVDCPQQGGTSVLERLTEVAFLELLRRQFLQATPAETGWLAAIADPALGRCLTLLHGEPVRDWTLASLARESGLSRSTLAERFEAVLGTSPIRYLRDWRLYLASVDLRTTERPTVAIGLDAGYGTEAAFSRAFSRHFGMPPAEWRRGARRSRSGAAALSD
nr:AraC family transcriptional regulator [Oceanibacterium hippocampi]